MTFICVGVVALIDNYLPGEDDYKPGIGGNYCFLQGNYRHAFHLNRFDSFTAQILCLISAYPKLVKILYLYLPMTIVYLVNIVFFILTSWKIRELKNDVDEMMSKKGNARKMRKTKDGLAIHYYLFRVHCTILYTVLIIGFFVF